MSIAENIKRRYVLLFERHIILYRNFSPYYKGGLAMKSIGRILIGCSLLVLIVSCSLSPSTPSDTLILQDWKRAAQICEKDGGYVTFGNVKIVGRSVEGNTAIVIVSVTGDWIKQKAKSYVWSLPFCYQFAPGESKETKKNVEIKIHYRKYDSTWKFEEITDTSGSLLVNLDLMRDLGL